MIKEIWTRIPGYPDYKISILGRIKRTKISRNKRPWRVGYIKKPQSQGRYQTVILYKKNVHKQFYIHRLVLFSFVGSCPPSFECNHKDGNNENDFNKTVQIYNYIICLSAVRFGIALGKGGK